MTIVQKNEIISRVIAVLNEILDTESQTAEISGKKDMIPKENQPVELLTVKECVETVNGLTEHTVRQLIMQNKIPCIRTGQGKRGKILINKSILLDYLKNST